MTAFSIANPPCVLTIDDPEPGLAFVPSVRRWSLSAYLAQVKGWKRWGAAVRAGEIVAVHRLAYDRRATDRMFECVDDRGASFLTVPPCVVLGLIVTARGTANLQLDMRQLFDDPNDAAQAAADAVRMLREMGTLIDNQRTDGTIDSLFQ